MNLITLQIKGFKSFIQPVDIYFEEHEAGLYNVTGKNLKEPELGSNGAGKSTIWQAWYWCLFGKTKGDMKAGDVESWEGEGYVQVVIEWSQQDKLYTLLRSRNPNKLTLMESADIEPYNVDQAKVEQVIKMTPEIFEATYLRYQYARDFFDLQPAEKTALLQQVLNLGHWLDKSKKAADLIKGADIEIQNKGREVSRLTGAEQQIIGQLKNLRERHQEENADKEVELKVIKTHIVKIQKEIKAVEAKDKMFEKEQDKLDEAEHEALKKYEVLNGKVLAMDGSLHKVRTNVVAKEKLIAYQEKQVREVGKIPTTCPVCSQKVTAKHKKACTDQMSKVVDTLKKELGPLIRKKEIEEEKQNKLSWQEREACEVLNEVRGENRVVSANILNVTSHLKDLKNELKSFTADLERAKVKSDGVEKDIRKQETAYAVAAKEKETIQAEMERQESCKKELEVWRDSFKNIRLFLMDEAIEELEVETNRVLDEVGLHGWTVQFDSERETQSGKISKGFSVSIFPPGKTEPVSWGAWSGGEAQRLRLAGRIGLANMIMTSCGLSSGVEVWDEPTQFVGEEGISDIKALLRTRAERHNLKIFLVDHRSYEVSGFTGKWTVTKNENGSVLEYV